MPPVPPPPPSVRAMRPGTPGRWSVACCSAGTSSSTRRPRSLSRPPSRPRSKQVRRLGRRPGVGVVPRPVASRCPDQGLGQPDHPLLVGLGYDQGAPGVGKDLLVHDDLAHGLVGLGDHPQDDEPAQLMASESWPQFPANYRPRCPQAGTPGDGGTPGAVEPSALRRALAPTSRPITAPTSRRRAPAGPRPSDAPTASPTGQSTAQPRSNPPAAAPPPRRPQTACPHPTE
jgi:hypothetical protein